MGIDPLKALFGRSAETAQASAPETAGDQSMAHASPLAEHADPYCLTDDEMIVTATSLPWRRLVVLGDSVAEGLGDLVDGYLPLPWADRVAHVMDRSRAGFRYLNLGERDLLAEDIEKTQLERAISFGPDLAVVAAGGNDALRRSYDAEAVDAVMNSIVSALSAAGCHVATMGLFDIAASPLVPPERRAALRERFDRLASHTRAVVERHGGTHVDLTSHPASCEASIYSADRLHVNGRGHAVAATEVFRALSTRRIDSPRTTTLRERRKDSDVRREPA
jgi:lysophospholipase L1-like esterase